MNLKNLFPMLKVKLFNFLVILLLLCLSGSFLFAQEKPLAERLGYKSTDKILIINSDDVGMNYAANMATIEGMENGLITSGTIMTPCPWFSHIAEYSRNNPDKDFGVHLTLTSEWRQYRWGSVSPDLLSESLFNYLRGLCKIIPG